MRTNSVSSAYTGHPRQLRARPSAYEYEIRVRGHFGTRLASAFPMLQVTTEHGESVLRGRLADQSALYGVLGDIEALGLELLALRRVSDRQADGTGNAQR